MGTIGSSAAIGAGRGLAAVRSAGEAALRPASVVLDSLRQPEVLREVGHRPWPLPDRPWLMGQVWEDLLFAHWRVPAVALRKIVPSQLDLDLYEGSAWIGVTPFRVRGLRLRGTLPAPLLSSFPEINVRTYVTVAGRPGIYFLSLDADSWLAVLAARTAYRLPYFASAIQMARHDDGVRYTARRRSPDGPPATFAATYRAAGEQLPLDGGSLERWLTERYCLYTLDEGQRVQRGEIHHPPWPLQQAAAEIGENTIARPFGLELAGQPLLHYAARQVVALWSISPVGD